MERSEYMKDIHRWENMRLNILTFKKKKKKKKAISQVYFCVFVRPDCCDQDNWEPVTLCCTVNAC